MNPELSPEPPPSERGPASASGGRLALLVLGIAVAAFAGGFLVTALFLFRGGAGDEVVTVPDLRGQTEAGARALTSRAGLGFEEGTSLVNPEVPEGQVLAQTPLPGEEVAPGSPVRVVLSAGPERRSVPEVRSLSAAQARDLLARSGFDAVVEEVEDVAPAGRVIEVYPGPGTQLAVPAEVRLVVSTGPPLEVVPDVFGMSEAQARTVLEAAGFRIGVPRYDDFAPYPAGTVVAQGPDAGAAVPVGSRVELTLAGAPGGNL